MTTTVLLIDSDIPFMASLKQAMESAGDFRVGVVANPAAAQQVLRHTRCDIAVMDFEVAGVDAQEMLRMLRFVQPDLPVIITPQDVLEVERAQFLEVQGAITKPFNARELIPRINDVLRRSGSGTRPGLVRPEAARGPAGTEVPPPPPTGAQRVPIGAQDMPPLAAPPPPLPAPLPETRARLPIGAEDVAPPSPTIRRIGRPPAPPAEPEAIDLPEPLPLPVELLPPQPEPDEVFDRFESFADLAPEPQAEPEATPDRFESFAEIVPEPQPLLEEDQDIFEVFGELSPAERDSEEVASFFDALAQEAPTEAPLDLDQLERPVTAMSFGDDQVLEDFETLERAQAEISEPPSTGPLGQVLRALDAAEADLETQFVEPVPDTEHGTRRLDQPDTPDDTRRLEPELEEPSSTSVLRWSKRGVPPAPPQPAPPAVPGGTQMLSEESELPDTGKLVEWEKPKDTGRLEDTEVYDISSRLEDWKLRRQMELRPSSAEPAPSVRQRLNIARPSDQERDLGQPEIAGATDEFGEVLHAVAKSPPTPPERTPDDQAFHALVDSLRRPEPERARRTRLDDLLASIASDVTKEEAPTGPLESLDYVLDAIQHSPPPDAAAEPRVAPDAPTQVSSGRQRESAEPPDMTIGEVIDGLFDPAFEGVLAALAGADMEEHEFEEPTYAPESEPLDDLARSGEQTRPGFRVEGGELADSLPEAPERFSAPRAGEIRPLRQEPATTLEDSWHYPATAALTAATSEGEDYSLDTLLSQIEDELPPARTVRPRLRPLPSWDMTGTLEGASEVRALFDHIEGVSRERITAEDIAAVLADHGPEPEPARLYDDIPWPEVIQEPPITIEDTQPSEAVRADRAGAPLAQDTLALLDAIARDRTPVETKPALLSEDELLARADLPPEAASHEIAEDRERFAAAPPELTVEPQEEEAIAAAFFAGVRETEPEYEPELEAASADHFAEVLEALGTETGVQQPEAEPYVEQAPAEEAQPWAFEAEVMAPQFAEEPKPPAYEPVFEPSEALPEGELFVSAPDAYPPEPEHFAAREGVPALPEVEPLVELSLDEATQRIVAVSDEAEEQAGEAETARVALMLTQYALESSAQTTLLSHGTTLLAHAGHLEPGAVNALFDEVVRAWSTSRTDSTSLMRYVGVPNVGEFLVYSVQVANELILSMAFHANTSLRTIRRQARRLSESLQLVPELPAEEVPPAAQTLPSRPTDVLPPEGLREAVAEVEPDVTVPRIVRPEPEPQTTYTALWLPRDPGCELIGELAEALEEHLTQIARASAWQIEALDIQRDFVLLTLTAPLKLSPDSVILHLMQRSAAHLAEQFPEATHGEPLWTDGYYVVTPPRELSDREISRIITVQRNAQVER